MNVKIKMEYDEINYGDRDDENVGLSMNHNGALIYITVDGRVVGVDTVELTKAIRILTE